MKEAYKTTNSCTYDRATTNGLGGADTNALDDKDFLTSRYKSFGGSFKAGNYIIYKNFNFGKPEEKTYGSFLLNLSADKAVSGAIEIRLGGLEGQLLALVNVKATGNIPGWPPIFMDHYSDILARNIDGIHDAYFVFKQDVSLHMDFFVFSEYYKSATEFNIRPDRYADDIQPELSKPDGVRYFFGDKDDERFEWLRNSRLAMFIHFGAYAEAAGYINKDSTYDNPKVCQTGEAEWIMRRSGDAGGRYSNNDYMRKVSANFRPHNWNAGEIVKLAQAAGQRYIILTTRHHEGLSLWDTQVRWNSDYKITTFTSDPHYYYKDRDPRKGYEHFELDLKTVPVYNKDIVRELSEACKATYGSDNPVYFGTYITIQDWYDPSQSMSDGRGDTALNPLQGAAYSYNDMQARLKASIRELLEEYDAKALWFDGSGNAVSSWYDDGRGTELYEFARAIKPHVLVNRRWHRGGTKTGENPPRGINHPWAQVDFHTPEQTLGPIDERLRDFETCMTIGGKWSYVPSDATESANKSVKTIVQYIVDCAAKGGNLLLNIGPMGDGSVTPVQRQRLEAVGQWMRMYGESIYGTKRSPMELYNPANGVYITVNPAKGKLYVHLIDYPGTALLPLPLVNKTITNAKELGNGNPVPHTVTNSCIYVHLSGMTRNDINTVVELAYDPKENDEPLETRPALGTSAIKITHPINNTLLSFPLETEGSYAAENGVSRIELLVSGTDKTGAGISRTIMLDSGEIGSMRWKHTVTEADITGMAPGSLSIMAMLYDIAISVENGEVEGGAAPPHGAFRPKTEPFFNGIVYRSGQLDTISDMSGIYRGMGTNLTEGKATYALSVKDGSCSAMAVDGNFGTRWAPLDVDGAESWIAVKLGDTPVAFNKVIITEWFDDEGTHPNYRSDAFRLEYRTAADGEWLTLLEANEIGERVIDFATVSGTDIRLWMGTGQETGSGGIYPPNIIQFEAYIV